MWGSQQVEPNISVYYLLACTEESSKHGMRSVAQFKPCDLGQQIEVRGGKSNCEELDTEMCRGRLLCTIYYQRSCPISAASQAYLKRASKRSCGTFCSTLERRSMLTLWWTSSASDLRAHRNYSSGGIWRSASARWPSHSRTSSCDAIKAKVKGSSLHLLIL